MKIFVHGKHDCHCGSTAVTERIQALIEASGHTYIDADTGSWNEADYILVNGEGSIYGDRGRDGGKLKICRRAKKEGISSSLINSIWQNITDPTAIDILKNDVDHVVVREAISYNEIKQHRPDAKIAYDIAYNFPYKPNSKSKSKTYVKGGFFSSPNIDFDQILNAYTNIRIKDYNHWCDYLDDLAGTDTLITGYHHEVIAACKLRIPFIAYKGNTDKVLGIIKHANVNIDVAETPEQLIDNIKKPIDINEYNKLFDFMESQKPFELKDIGLARTKKKKKVAICISGEPRMYKHTAQSIHRYFGQLGKDWEYDIFIHAWNSTSTPRNYRDGRIDKGHVDDYEQTYNITELRCDLIQRYKPKRILVESKDTLKNMADYYNVRVPADQIMNSNFLAMSQHISAERAAYLKSGKDIILPTQPIVGEVGDNEYDVVIKTRFDVMFFPKRSQLENITAKISRFDRKTYTRTQYGMTFFPTLTVRNGGLACEFGHFWSGNTQFDMIYDSMFRRLHSSTDVNIYDSCHHHAFASHCLNQGISMREWRRITRPSKVIDPEGGRDFIWVLPGAPIGEHPIRTYRKYYRSYSKDHEKRMKSIDNDMQKRNNIEREYQKKLARERKVHDAGMADVRSGKKKDIWYNEKVYFVDVKRIAEVDGTVTATLPGGIIVEWCNKGEEWVKGRDSYQNV